ncbi:MAG: amidohydrolase family protein [Verrucomicrobiota bacterium]
MVPRIVSALRRGVRPWPLRYSARFQVQIIALLCGSGVLLSQALSAAELLPPGFRPHPPGVHALVGATIVIKPGTTIDTGVIIIRDGLIEAVGETLQIPADAREWDMKGATIYAGLIEPYLTQAARGSNSGGTDSADSAHNSHSSDRADGGLTADGPKFFGVAGEGRDPGQRGPGHSVARITPERRMADALSLDPKLLESLRELGFTAANVAPDSGILRGTSACLTLSDANPNETILKPDVFQHASFDTGGRDSYPGSLMGTIACLRQALLDGQHYAADWSDWRQRGQGRTRPEFNVALEALGPVLGKNMPIVFEPKSALMIDRAARLAREFGLNFVLVSSGQEWRRPELARAAGVPFIVPIHFPEVHKMPEEDDWLSISLDQLRVWDWAAENPGMLRKQGLDIALTTASLPDRKNFRKNLRLAIDRGLAEQDALAALTTMPAKLLGVDRLIGTIEPGKIANLTVVNGKSYFDPTNKLREVWVDGRVYPLEFERRKPKPETAVQAASATTTETKKPEAGADKKKETDRRELLKKRVARSPQEKRGAIATPKSILVENATIWTCGPAGRIEKGSLLIVDGKIAEVSATPIAREKAGPTGPELVIDAAGRHVTPGLIDAHSHAMILGGVNESSLPSTAMVRVADVVNSETDNIFEQLAGGLTVANLLHGSANPIGGQNCIIKLKEGALPEDLKMSAAPAGIKFALGENVKQSNWGDRNTTRFPQTRMGVRTFMANRFIAARRYLEDWDAYRKGGRTVPPRRDLELEALGEILQGRRWIHCHSYRQDEILAFLRLMESFGIKVGTLQHVLEGYKVADEIARHGAGASCFSDWWAYKFEVYDAIPYAGSLMRERGVLVSFNSDDADLARRMSFEAAKAVKYGGTSEEEALKFVTLNPAKQLRVEARIGSLESGKDADFVLWSKSPLDATTLCEETWIEGRKYFDLKYAAERAAALEQEWKALIEKAKKVTGTSTESPKEDARDTSFFAIALEHLHDHVNRHCDDK